LVPIGPVFLVCRKFSAVSASNNGGMVSFRPSFCADGAMGKIDDYKQREVILNKQSQ